MPYYFYMCDMIPGSEHWRLTLSEGQSLQHEIMGYLPGFATPRMVCDVPYVGKRWLHQVSRYDTDHGISYWTKITVRPSRPMTSWRSAASIPTTTRSTCCPNRARPGGGTSSHSAPARTPGRPVWLGSLVAAAQLVRNAV